MKHTVRIQPEQAWVTSMVRGGIGRKEVEVFRVVCSCGYCSPIPHLEKHGAMAEKQGHLAQAAEGDRDDLLPVG